MIKIVKAVYVSGYTVELYFSNGKKGSFDFSDLVSRQGELVTPLKDTAYFQQFFLELGAICWKNGLEFSPSSLYRKLEQLHLLRNDDQAA